MASLERAAGARRPGMKLIFELTDRCNFSCTHCLRGEDGAKVYLPLPLIDKVLAEAAAYGGFDHVALTGGEPTLHPDFGAVVEHVAAAGYRLSMVTNGWTFGQVIAVLAEHREAVDHVAFSLDGAREATHDALRHRQGSFRRVMEGVSHCRFHGIPVHLQMVVMTANRDQLEAMAVLAARLGCAALGFAHCQPTADGLAAGLVLDDAARRRAEAEIADLGQAFRLPIRLAGDHWRASLFPTCPQLQLREVNIDYRGYLTACCTLSSYRGGTPDSEVVADLNAMSFFQAHRRLVDKVAEVQRARIARIASTELGASDHFLCSHCRQHYGKVVTADGASGAVVRIGARAEAR